MYVLSLSCVGNSADQRPHRSEYQQYQEATLEDEDVEEMEMLRL